MSPTLKTSNLKWSLIPPVLLIVTIISFSVLFNMSIIDVRFQELDKILYEVSHQQDLNNSLNMLAKYSIIKRRMERGSDNTEDYAVESKVMAIIAGDFLRDKPQEKSAWNHVYPVVRIGVNAIRLFMGKEIINETRVETDDKELEVAYFYERNRKYKKALDIYLSILKARKHSPQKESYIILHKGFCESMNGEFDKARSSYEEIIGRFPDSETAMVSWKLLDFLNTMDDSLKVIQKEGIRNIQYGKKLYLLMDYKNAIAVFADIEKKSRSDNDFAEVAFLKGRCHEELGENGLAIENYKTAIEKAPISSWAKDANRRILIIGEFYERDKQISQIAFNRLKEYRDENFFDELSTFSDIMEESKATDKIRLQEREEVKKALSKGDMDVLSLIQNIDLSGEKAAQEEVKAAEKALALKVSKKEVAQEVLDVNMHPLRKPSFIQREIMKKIPPLKAMYNTILKRGADFQGTLKVSFAIEASGAVSHVRIEEDSDIQDAEFQRKILELVRAWTFPQIEDKYPSQTITYPIVFKKAE
ncbi:MAG: hypothetical protein A2268_09695 [Candidatus Raymondbacteria bacterium RifOxyA12_full_50_37]|uniref:TonB C-terminal domain-containing protein n=1 Tax=Candidatus Raymondbacteria bacterium RIFOXYD12_FULL_49_13 TaxID=1817890 RepID=A0A1F7F1R0_UNCRA|nr:MAG: hypothetical protein A2268_09695 [Candidatus Raymondbacteria bacterium RifOxyA12_full_50_37]OGJ93158.1 MAG: hypothetical protein A2350_17890 [Candidatus Raymondbacteria bacterium RifOxyB12_full_50_8]OGJ93887.1 MAG: hypothetical protein A2248_06600 [Candidatus Raymondbacteria bacterium RIFOXYA2_FULL_49_16]OGJ98244.1 MAG: hypothetical protein A2453_00565 [Candidatus Raymondbacteria bacterium RIFOXYC2_FULL_50_21]OGK00477.1 MAG: hypothetical protein A2519_10740 [Candidatus Raymondbacteria b